MSWFDQLPHQWRLDTAVKQWLGTPFAAHQCCPGVGVDCVQLAGALMLAAGVLERQPDFGAYSLDLAAHTKRERIVEWLEGTPRFWLLGGSRPVIGDLVTFRIGKAINHVGVMINCRDFVHSIQGARVSESTLDDATWGTRLAQVWRAI